MNRILPIWRIAYKELIAYRDMRMLIYMLVTPVVIILLLGTMLTDVFSSSKTIEQVRILYQDNSRESSLAEYWEAFAGQSAAAGILLERADGDEGIREVEYNRYAGYAELTDEGIRYYGSSRSTIESDIGESVISAFADRYKLAAVLAKEDSAREDALMANIVIPEHVQDMSLAGNRLPSAMDYYAVAMTTLIVMYGAMMAAGLISGERSRGTAVRLMAAPISKNQIFIGKILGSLLQHMLAVLFIILICKYMFNVYWGDNLGLVFLVMTSQIIFVISLGLGFSYIFKATAANTILMIIIQIAAFIGGSYFPLKDVTGVLRVIASFSPLEWTNTAILQIIYADGGMAVVNAIALNIGFSIALLSAAAWIMRKREGL